MYVLPKNIKRDMKAANILITKQGILKLADFGLARAISINKQGHPNRYVLRRMYCILTPVLLGILTVW